MSEELKRKISSANIGKKKPHSEDVKRMRKEKNEKLRQSNWVKKVCENCNNEFLDKSCKPTRKFCSKSCSSTFINSNRPFVTNCKFCKKEMKFRNNHLRYAPVCKECFKKEPSAWKNVNVCKSCGKKSPSALGIDTNRNCKSCAALFQLSQNHQRGHDGHFKGHYFRSSMELFYMIILDNEGHEWESAEKGVYAIPYVFEGVRKNYFPDFLVDKKKLVEIKPEYMQEQLIVKAKKEAAINWCKENNYEYEMVSTGTFRPKDLLKMHNEGLIELTHKTLAKLLRKPGYVKKDGWR